MTLQEAMDDFLFQKQLAGLSPKTVISYKESISLLVRFMGNDIALSEVTYTEVSKYIMHLYKRPLSRATVSTYVRNIRIFLRWVYIEYELPFDPQKIKVPKSPKKIVHIYNDTEIKEIFALKAFVKGVRGYFSYYLRRFSLCFCLNNAFQPVLRSQTATMVKKHFDFIICFALLNHKNSIRLIFLRMVIWSG